MNGADLPIETIQAVALTFAGLIVIAVAWPLVWTSRMRNSKWRPAFSQYGHAAGTPVSDIVTGLNNLSGIGQNHASLGNYPSGTGIRTVSLEEDPTDKAAEDRRAAVDRHRRLT